ncbi:MAG: hypothetical protein A3I05_08200 [Deltaproteobacteria bacterium RIFCSPLOWO2_02_FULL_44_10]|nr:MAG: hypothetical protein A3C46_05085 [Deltaproteobacteria bacterium RIFCSPHIGHO2_02_FULL_44_16]OGQ45940.1 MAG: hypothetical protein A3I05_08200 [Deltaproteobacteria bacterium RIFCSPLOWO2_02_FULL_44_10]
MLAPHASMKKELIEHVRQLSRLRFSKEVEERLVKKVTAIMGYVERLNELNTEHIEPTSHAMISSGPSSGNLREDRVILSTLASDILSVAPERDGASIQVPKVIDS